VSFLGTALGMAPFTPTSTATAAPVATGGSVGTVGTAATVGTPGTVGTPTGAAFDIVLILHVACMLIAFASLFTTGVQAWRARRGPEAASAPSVARYFRPGINWPGRAIYLVLVFGICLVAMSGHAYDFGDPFVQIGLILWIVAVSVAELVVWPGERMLQGVISESPVGAGGEAGPGDPEAPALWVSTPREAAVALRVALSAWTVCAVLIVATVVMVQKP
jgi:hypothetical protein